MRPVSKLTPRTISNFCNVRVAPHLSPRETECLRQYLLHLLEWRYFPPYVRNHIDCHTIAGACGLETDRLIAVRAHIQPVFDAMCRALADAGESRFDQKLLISTEK